MTDLMVGDIVKVNCHYNDYTNTGDIGVVTGVDQGVKDKLITLHQPTKGKVTLMYQFRAEKIGHIDV